MVNTFTWHMKGPWFKYLRTQILGGLHQYVLQKPVLIQIFGSDYCGDFLQTKETKEAMESKSIIIFNGLVCIWNIKKKQC